MSRSEHESWTPWCPLLHAPAPTEPTDTGTTYPCWEKKKERRVVRNIWVRDWILRRPQLELYDRLIVELRNEALDQQMWRPAVCGRFMPRFRRHINLFTAFEYVQTGYPCLDSASAVEQPPTAIPRTTTYNHVQSTVKLSVNSQSQK